MKISVTQPDGSPLADTSMTVYVFSNPIDFEPYKVHTDSNGTFELEDEHQGRRILAYLDRRLQPAIDAVDGATLAVKYPGKHTGRHAAR